MPPSTTIKLLLVASRRLPPGDRHGSRFRVNAQVITVLNEINDVSIKSIHHRRIRKQGPRKGRALAPITDDRPRCFSTLKEIEKTEGITRTPLACRTDQDLSGHVFSP